jgi:hypothetical protein
MLNVLLLCPGVQCTTLAMMSSGCVEVFVAEYNYTIKTMLHYRNKRPVANLDHRAVHHYTGYLRPDSLTADLSNVSRAVRV